MTRRSHRPRPPRRLRHAPALAVGPCVMARAEALALQEELVRARAEERVPDVFLFAEHEAGVGYGWGTPLPRSEPGPWEDRGGGVALYGPGMLTGYLVLDTEVEHWGMYYLARRVGRALGRVLGEHLLDVDRVAGLPPAHIGGRRVATVGLGLQGSTTRFGFNLGVHGDLAELGAELPAALRSEPRTTIAAETPGEPVDLEDVATSAMVHLGQALRRRIRRIDVDELRDRAGLSPGPKPAATPAATPEPELESETASRSSETPLP